MKSLLNITVFTSAVLSIFSTSLTLYEVPELKEALSVMEEKKLDHETESQIDMKRIYISHDVSDKTERNSEPVLVTKNSNVDPTSAEDDMTVFGVTISNNTKHKNS